jgi:hypothetical protein
MNAFVKTNALIVNASDLHVFLGIPPPLTLQRPHHRPQPSANTANLNYPPYIFNQTLSSLTIRQRHFNMDVTLPTLYCVVIASAVSMRNHVANCLQATTECDSSYLVLGLLRLHMIYYMCNLFFRRVLFPRGLEFYIGIPFWMCLLLLGFPKDFEIHPCATAGRIRASHYYLESLPVVFTRSILCAYLLMRLCEYICLENEFFSRT